MGKKGKGIKKEDKPKKDVPQTIAAKNKAMQEALERTNVPVSTPTPRPPPPPPTPRASASKKSDRGSSAPIKIGCTESFRWENSEEVPVLPPIEQCDRNRTATVVLGRSFFQREESFPVRLFRSLRSWGLYLRWRCNGDKDLLESASKNKTLKDGLSAPLLIATMIFEWMLSTSNGSTLSAVETGEPLHVVVIGATAVYEEKILRESDYWGELLAILSRRKVRLYLTGPEMSGKDGEFKRKRPGGEEGQQHQEEDGPRVECWKTSAVDFFLKKGRLELFQKEDTVVVGLNCGFEVATRQVLNVVASKVDLSTSQALWNWIPTLHFIAALELPLMLTGSCKDDPMFSRLVVEYMVGMYCVREPNGSPTPAESVISQAEREVRANSFYLIAQGQQPGHRFATEPPSTGEQDSRIETLRKVANRWQLISSRRWLIHPSTSGTARFQPTGVRERAASSLVPLKRYGNYPPENQDKCGHPDDGQSESDMPVGAVRGKEKEGLLPPVVVKLKHSSVVDEGSGTLKIILEDVFMTDPATARVGMRRNKFALHFFDCQTLHDVVFEADIPKEVDHTTTQITFQRSAASVTIVARLLESNK